METLTIQIPFSGFYESYWGFLIDSEIEREDEYRKETGGDELKCGDWDWNAAAEYICKEYVKGFTKLLKEEFNLDVAFEYDHMYSPREYNFTTDKIFVRISEEDCKKIYAKVSEEKHKEAFLKFIKENYSPRSGFMPFERYSYGSQDWVDENFDEGHYYVMLKYLLDYYEKNGDNDGSSHIEYLANRNGFSEGVYNALF